MSFMELADRQYAEALGQERPDQAWILSDRDVWYRNPYYKGPPQPHPEEYNYGTPYEVDPIWDCKQVFILWYFIDWGHTDEQIFAEFEKQNRTISQNEINDARTRYNNLRKEVADDDIPF